MATLTPCFVVELHEELCEVAALRFVAFVVRFEGEGRVDGLEGEVTHGLSLGLNRVLVQQPEHLPAPLLHHRREQLPDLCKRNDAIV